MDRVRKITAGGNRDRWPGFFPNPFWNKSFGKLQAEKARGAEKQGGRSRQPQSDHLLRERTDSHQPSSHEIGRGEAGGNAAAGGDAGGGDCATAGAMAGAHQPTCQKKTRGMR